MSPSGTHFFHGESYSLILTKNPLGCNSGYFFTNPSGHPDKGFVSGIDFFSGRSGTGVGSAR
jgi:hypothetical protein